MTAGLPGAGIGGIFYLVAALLMPGCEVARVVRGGPPERRWRLVARQSCLAAGILAAMWVTGWVLGRAIVVARPLLPATLDAAAADRTPVVFGWAVMAMTMGTLVAVLVAVEALRVVMKGTRSRRRDAYGGLPVTLRRQRARLTGLMLLAVLLHPTPIAAEPPAPAQTRVADLLARAEAAFDRGDAVEAERHYAAVLDADPEHPRALFRLAQLRPQYPATRVMLLRRYVRVEPEDAWGHLALAHALADAGSGADNVLAAYAPAAALEADDRDIVLGRPRLLARLGRRDAAIRSYESWLAAHRDDGEAWRELGEQRQQVGRMRGSVEAFERAAALMPEDPLVERRLRAARLRAAPAIEVGMLAGGETGLASRGLRLGASVPVADAARLGASLLENRIESGGEIVESRRLLMEAVLRPREALHVNASGGIVWSGIEGVEEAGQVRPEFAFRVRRAAGGEGTIVDLRARHGAVDVSPAMARAQLARSQVAAAVDLPIGGPWRLRGSARADRLAAQSEVNRRLGYGGGLAARVAPGAHVSGQWQQITYRTAATDSGYFAPRLAQIVEIGADVERDAGPVSVGIDAGAGVQRFQRHGESMGGWAPAFRLWGFTAWAVRPGRQLIAEIETYDSRIAAAAAADTVDAWRSAALTLSLRVALR